MLFTWVGLCSSATFTDVGIIYQSKKFDGQPVKFSFPFIVTEDKVVADRINTFLHERELEIPPPAKINPIKGESTPLPLDFKFMFEEMESRGISLMNSGRTLSVFIYGEGCGASCSSSTSRYDFDTRTGRYLFQEEIFSPQGRISLANKAVEIHDNTLKKKIAQLNKRRKAGTLEKGGALSEEDRERQLEFYKDCLIERNLKYSKLNKGDIKFPGIMKIGDGSLIFGEYVCTNFASSDSNTSALAYQSYTLSGEELRPYLSTYGIYLLLGEGDGTMPAINPYAQIFRGKINGNIPVTLYFASTPAEEYRANNFQAIYFYDKYRINIELSVAQKGDKFELTEYESKETPKPVLSFRIENEKLIGDWRGNGKIYSFEAAP